jgi:hypothetical protein
MLPSAMLVPCVPTPCTTSPGCDLNNVNSQTASPERCPLYGVEQVFNE